MRTEFERVSPEEVGIKSSDVLDFVKILESGFTEMHGLQIMRNNKICCEGWWAPYAPGMVHGLQSLSKTYTATAIGIAYTHGLLQLEEKIVDIFPALSPLSPSENLQQLTVHHVLCMSCGMQEMPQPSRNWIKDFLHTEVVNVPGSTYMYNSVGSSLLGAIIKQKTGENLHAFLSKHLYNKIGIDPNNTKWLYMPDGIEVGGGGFFATTEDNLRLMKLYADNGLWNGERILSDAYVQRATSFQIASASEVKNNPTAVDNFFGYGYQIWLCSQENVYRADGAMGQFSIVFKDKNMIISVNETALEAHWAQKTLDAIWSFAEKVSEEKPLAHNYNASTNLKTYMTTRAIKSPIYNPFSSKLSLLNKKTFIIKQGVFSFEDHLATMMAGNHCDDSIKKISFSFSHSGCELTYVKEKSQKPYTIQIATDGTRTMNFMKFKNNPCNKLLLNGYWKNQNTFVVVMRWIETCFEKELSFTIQEGTTLLLEEKRTIGFFGPEHKKEIIVAELA